MCLCLFVCVSVLHLREFNLISSDLLSLLWPVHVPPILPNYPKRHPGIMHRTDSRMAQMDHECPTKSTTIWNKPRRWRCQSTPMHAVLKSIRSFYPIQKWAMQQPRLLYSWKLKRKIMRIREILTHIRQKLCTYNVGCMNSMAVGVHAPRINRSINLVKPAPLPFNVPMMIMTMYAFGYNFAACVTPSWIYRIAQKLFYPYFSKLKIQSKIPQILPSCIDKSPSWRLQSLWSVKIWQSA